MTTFEVRAHPRRTDAKGAPVLLEYVRILDGVDVVHRAATDEDRRTYARAYAAFKSAAPAAVAAEVVKFEPPAPDATPDDAPEDDETPADSPKGFFKKKKK